MSIGPGGVTDIHPLSDLSIDGLDDAAAPLPTAGGDVPPAIDGNLDGVTDALILGEPGDPRHGSIDATVERVVRAMAADPAELGGA